MEAGFAYGSMVLYISFGKNVALYATFFPKRWNLPPCRRRIGPFIQVNTWFGSDRVTRVTNILPF
jgi:hypothetical protein